MVGCRANSEFSMLYIMKPEGLRSAAKRSIIEGTKESLERLQMDYVDVVFAHRPDPTSKFL